MAYLIGFILPLMVAAFLSLAGMVRERALYPLTLMVVASTYCLFAAIGGGTEAILGDLPIFGGFVALAALSFRTSLWLACAGLVGHGLLDIVHGHLVQNPGVPIWWPEFCATYDFVAALVLAGQLSGRFHPTAAIADIRPSIMNGNRPGCRVTN